MARPTWPERLTLTLSAPADTGAAATGCGPPGGPTPVAVLGGPTVRPGRVPGCCVTTTFRASGGGNPGAVAGGGGIWNDRAALAGGTPVAEAGGCCPTFRDRLSTCRCNASI